MGGPGDWLPFTPKTYRRHTGDCPTPPPNSSPIPSTACPIPDLGTRQAHVKPGLGGAFPARPRCLMSSELKIESNRRNAQLSTGPKTPEGKARVATNSCTHGLCSRNVILPEEDPAEFHALLDGLLSEFQPANAREESHVRELASAEWRLRRIVRLETGTFVSAMEKVREYERCRSSAPSLDRTPPHNVPFTRAPCSLLKPARPHLDQSPYCHRPERSRRFSCPLPLRSRRDSMEDTCRRGVSRGLQNVLLGIPAGRHESAGLGLKYQHNRQLRRARGSRQSPPEAHYAGPCDSAHRTR